MSVVKLFPNLFEGVYVNNMLLIYRKLQMLVFLNDSDNFLTKRHPEKI